MDPKFNEFEDEGLNIGQDNYGHGGHDHRGNGVEDLSMGVPRGNEPEPKGNPQP